MPASNQPVLTMVTWRPLVRSTVGPHPAEHTAAAQSSSRTSARIARHSTLRNAECGLRSARSEDLDLDAIERLGSRDLAGEEIGEVRSLQADDARARCHVRR